MSNLDDTRAEPTIGERIREFAPTAYTQVELAVGTDVSVDVIRKLEQGRRQTTSIGTLQRIASVQNWRPCGRTVPRMVALAGASARRHVSRRSRSMLVLTPATRDAIRRNLAQVFPHSPPRATMPVWAGSRARRPKVEWLLDR